MLSCGPDLFRPAPRIQVLASAAKSKVQGRQRNIFDLCFGLDILRQDFGLSQSYHTILSRKSGDEGNASNGNEQPNQVSDGDK